MLACVLSMLEPGTAIRDTYTVEELLGAGAFGEVYRVRHRYLGTQALKVFAGNRPDIKLDNFLQEAQLLSSMSSPHLVRVFEANVLDAWLGSRPYITMEYVSGGTLEDVLQER